MIKKTKEISGFKYPQNISAEVKETLIGKGCVIEKIVIKRDNGIDLPALLFKPAKYKKKLAAVVIVDERGKTYEMGEHGLIQKLLSEEKVVFSVDVSGHGELFVEPGSQNIKYNNLELATATLGFFTGTTIVGIKAADIIAATNYIKTLDYVNKDNIELTTYGKIGVAALHAVVFEKNFSSFDIRNSISSWEYVINNTLTPNNLGIVLPKVLDYYDLSDLMDYYNKSDNQVSKNRNKISNDFSMYSDIYELIKNRIHTVSVEGERVLSTYAMISGVKNGWLDAETYGPVARKGWLALVNHINEDDLLTDVCEGTSIKNDRNHYMNRRRITGDLHGQAPLLWCAVALLRNNK